MSTSAFPNEVLDRIFRELEPRDDDLIHRCGAGILTKLSSALRSLQRLHLTHTPSTSTHLEPFSSLLTFADLQIRCVHYKDVTPEWFRLYTDATLGSVVCHLMDEREGMRSRKKVLELVGQLDMAVIIAGGLGREELVQDVIKALQITYLARIGSPMAPAAYAAQIGRHVEQRDGRARDTTGAAEIHSPLGKRSSSSEQGIDEYRIKRRKLDHEVARSAEDRLIAAPNPIPILDRPPTISQFRSIHCQRPFILRNYIQPPSPSSSSSSSSTEVNLSPEWPALSPAHWSSPSYLLSKVGLGRLVPVELGKSYTDVGWGQKIIPFEVFLRDVGMKGVEQYFGEFGLELRGEKVAILGDEGGEGESDQEEDGQSADSSESDAAAREPDNRPMYLAQHDLFRQFPELALDIEHPPYVYAAPDPPHDYPTYQPPGNDMGVVTNVWVGSGRAGINSPAHTDPYFNYYVQVLGTKRVWLAPPAAGPAMYAFKKNDPDIEVEEESSDAEAEDEDTFTTDYTDNTSRVKIFSADLDTKSKRWPAFMNKAYPLSMEAVLQPGDMLFMPPGWWHAMQGEEDDVVWSVSMWF